MEENPKKQDAAVAPAEASAKEMMQVFASQASFAVAQRMAQALAASTIVPAQFQNNVANCLIALEMANRIGASPLLVMQNLYVVHGNVGWSSKFLIASLNTCGRFSPLRYEHENHGDMDKWRCRAWAIDRTTETALHGAWVSMEMVRAEGWLSKAGSKWKTMPELMFQYRAAAFFQRAYAPEISMGMRTAEEVEDMTPEGIGELPRRAEAGSFDPRELRTHADVNAALVRGYIGKEEAEALRERITRQQAAQDLTAAITRTFGPASDTEAASPEPAAAAEGDLFPAEQS